jgi:hypothetical protein
MLVLDGRRPALGDQVCDLVVDLILAELGKETEGFESVGGLVITSLLYLYLLLS